MKITNRISENKEPLVYETSLNYIRKILYPLHSNSKGLIYFRNGERVENVKAIERLKKSKTNTITIFDVDESTMKKVLKENRNIHDDEIYKVWVLTLKNDTVTMTEGD